ncbi:hypothetical protein I553_9194 [Mycobacterium xenopi 4042]|uniref:Uncharacterized protein n=1 Tax=Mycobacterium xenopi 4042 TaxID=1299334 RepID=X8AA89_MYCXE|nr:hypothetical protein I553_9194 [Mycobacterium xenopi 4042]
MANSRDARRLTAFEQAPLVMLSIGAAVSGVLALPRSARYSAAPWTTDQPPRQRFSGWPVLLCCRSGLW